MFLTDQHRFFMQVLLSERNITHATATAALFAGHRIKRINLSERARLPLDAVVAALNQALRHLDFAIKSGFDYETGD